jgi:hypothetical protein
MSQTRTLTPVERRRSAMRDGPFCNRRGGGHHRTSGSVHGVTVNSLTSVSLDPFLLLVLSLAMSSLANLSSFGAAGKADTSRRLPRS